MTTKVTGSVLSNTDVTAGTYGSASLIPIITVDAQGRITSATAATVTGGGGGSGTTTYTVTKFTATAGQTLFTVDYTVGYVQVYLNGVLLDYATEFTAANGTSITLTTGAALNDIISVYAYSVTSVSNITGGAAGAVLYQAAANTTSNTNVGTTGQLLTSAGAGKPIWSAQTSLSIANTQITGLITAAQLAPGAGSGGFSNMQVFTSSGTFTVPTGITKVKVTVVGGGGGGGGIYSGTLTAGGGGGGGTAIEIISGLTPAGTVSVTVGTGGTAGTYIGGGGVSATNGGNGGTSSFGAYCSATGGTGGGGQNVTPSNGTGGLGSGGDLNIKGGTGGPFGGPSLSIGGNSFLGGIAVSPYTGGATAGATYGGGGTGAYVPDDSGAGVGGVGAAGVVIVEY